MVLGLEKDESVGNNSIILGLNECREWILDVGNSSHKLVLGL